MKRLIFVFLVLVIMLFSSACSESPVTFNADYSELYYHGYTYRCDEHYTVDIKDKACIWITDITGLIGTNSYYGNDVEKPDYLWEKFRGEFWLREDLCIDRDTPLTLWRCWHDHKYLDLQGNEFTIAEVTTGEVVRLTLDNDEDFDLLYDFDVKVTPYSAVYQNILIHEKDGVFYMQESFKSDYYVITQEFYDEISRIVPPFEPI